MFQHTAARRRLLSALDKFSALQTVSTHSRPKAAASPVILNKSAFNGVSTHSRPKAAA